MGYLLEEDIRILGEEVVTSENLGHLTEKQLDIIYNKKLFNMFVPKEFGGLGLSLMEGLEIEEQLAKIDGSLGWTVTMCGGANMFIGYLDSFLARMIFQNKQVCFGGSANIDGIAKVTKDGYLINGTWDYIVGLKHCTVLTVNCFIEKDGEILLDDKGKRVFKSFFFFPREIKVIEDGRCVGLLGTGSHSFKIENLRVKDNRTFTVNSDKRVIDSLTYQYPFLQFALFTLTANHLGMQAHFLDELKKYFDSECYNKYFEFKGELFESYQAKFNERRNAFYNLAEESWNEIATNGSLSEETEKKIDYLCKHIAHSGRSSILKVLPYLGMQAVRHDTTISRIVRDILTASQFSLLLPDFDNE